MTIKITDDTMIDVSLRSQPRIITKPWSFVKTKFLIDIDFIRLAEKALSKKYRYNMPEIGLSLKVVLTKELTK